VAVPLGVRVEEIPGASDGGAPPMRVSGGAPRRATGSSSLRIERRRRRSQGERASDGGIPPGSSEREMCPWAISKYFDD
jgi:hypothetical protein